MICNIYIYICPAILSNFVLEFFSPTVTFINEPKKISSPADINLKFLSTRRGCPEVSSQSLGFLSPKSLQRHHITWEPRVAIFGTLGKPKQRDHGGRGGGG